MTYHAFATCYIYSALIRGLQYFLGNIIEDQDQDAPLDACRTGSAFCKDLTLKCTVMHLLHSVLTHNLYKFMDSNIEDPDQDASTESS